MKYEEMIFKIPEESDFYPQNSEYVVVTIEKIIGQAIKNGRNKIIINTNLRLGLPMENINKIAGPFVEAWAYEIFNEIAENTDNEYKLVNVEAQSRLNLSDIILQFKKNTNRSSIITAEVDVKATAEDIKTSGLAPNVTSFAKIRTAYVQDPDILFIVLSLKHRVLVQKNKKTDLMDGIMEVVGFNAYDLKYLSSSDISYNPALGTGQIQIRDIHYVTMTKRSVWEFCQILDKKYINSSNNSIKKWHLLAIKYGWIKKND